MGHGIRAGIIGRVRSGLLRQPRCVLSSRLWIRIWSGWEGWDTVTLLSAIPRWFRYRRHHRLFTYSARKSCKSSHKPKHPTIGIIAAIRKATIPM